MPNISYKNKVEGCLLIASFLETIGFYNGKWEFNYGNKITNLKDALIINNILLNDYYMQGGLDNLNIKGLNSSDDTILLIATGSAVVNGGGEKNYIDYYLKWADILKEERRISGISTLASLEKIRIKKTIKAIEYSTSHGGNGCAIRTAPIGLKYYNDIDKLCEEALVASLVTHNYPMGYLSGIIAALFTAYAVQDINPFEWSNNLIKLYKKNFFHELVSKYSDNVDKEINEYFIYWEKYNEDRLIHMKTRKLNIFMSYYEKILDLVNYSSINYSKDSKGWDRFGGSGLEAVILAYDNLLLSAVPDNKMIVDIKNPVFDWNVLFYNNIFFFGDNDSVSAISGAWFGAFKGIDRFPIELIKDLEYYKDLIKIIEKF